MDHVADPSFWTAAGVILLAVVAVLSGLPQKAAAAVDRKGAEIAGRLDQASQLREEARKEHTRALEQQREAAETAGQIVAMAREQAENLLIDARETLARRESSRRRAAEEQITHATRRAERQLQATIADIAVRTAAVLVTERLRDDNEGKAVMQEAIGRVRKTLG